MVTLNDTEIRTEFEAGRLIKNANPGGATGACYELRMGSIYYDLTEDGTRFDLGEGEKILIKPGHQVVLITLEDLDIPVDILARIVSKGSLFSIGLSPVATYADPGFKGHIGIVTQNMSDKYIELPQGEPIAKADFTRLSAAASAPYHGQHGFQAKIWPIKSYLQKSHKDVKNDRRVGTERNEALALLPDATRTIIRRLENTQAWINVGLILAIFINAFALFALEKQWMDAIHAIAINLGSSAILGIGALITTYLRRI